MPRSIFEIDRHLPQTFAKAIYHYLYRLFLCNGMPLIGIRQTQIYVKEADSGRVCGLFSSFEGLPVQGRPPDSTMEIEVFQA